MPQASNTRNRDEQHTRRYNRMQLDLDWVRIKMKPASRLKPDKTVEDKMSSILLGIFLWGLRKPINATTFGNPENPRIYHPNSGRSQRTPESVLLMQALCHMQLLCAHLKLDRRKQLRPYTLLRAHSLAPTSKMPARRASPMLSLSLFALATSSKRTDSARPIEQALPRGVAPWCLSYGDMPRLHMP